jgi:signal transduction histidine kinase
VIQTIRARIGVFSFATFVALAALGGALVLGGLERALTAAADRELLSDLEELAAEVADRRLGALVAEGPEDVEWGDLVFEMRDALDAELERAGAEGAFLYEIRREGAPRVAASPGLEERSLERGGAALLRQGVALRTERDPRSPRGRVRVAELALGPYRLELARSLEPFDALRASVRTQLLGILVAVCLAAAAGAYAIAAWGLAPVRRLTDEARRLGALAEGTLPRTRRGDEIDALAEVLNALLSRVRGEVLRTRQFTADAAHEIRTPLAAVRGHLELLLGEVDAPAQATLSGVLEEVERLGRIVSQLLLLEKLEASPEVASRARLDLGELARDLVDHLRVLASERGIELSCEWTPTPVLGDAEQLRRLFLNLIDNAFRHTPAGGRVEVRVGRQGATARAVVRDTGPGIAADRLERVFDRFASDRSRADAGSGLGLPIARAIARAHDGELRAASPGGAELTLELPAAPR